MSTVSFAPRWHADRPSLRAGAVRLLLRLTRRRRVYASVPGLMAGIAHSRRSGAASIPPAVCARLDVRRELLGRHAIVTLAPRDAAAGGPALFYLHGGGYCRPITACHWALLAWLVRATGRTVVAPLYPLAPEHDSITTLAWLRAAHARFVQRHGTGHPLAGDSSGASLALALAQQLRDDDLPLPAGLSLITPLADVSLMHLDIADIAPRDPMLGVSGLREAGRLWAGRLSVEHPLVSPLHADLRGLPPLQILVAGDDILGPDALCLADRARASGCTVELHAMPGMVHAWPLLPMPEAREARRWIRDFLAR